MRNEVFVYLEIYSVYLEIYDYGVLVQGVRFPDVLRNYFLVGLTEELLRFTSYLGIT